MLCKMAAKNKAKKDFEPIPPSLKIGEEVSRGSFGVVFLATLDKNPVAVKEFHKVLLSGESIHLQNFRRECEQLKRLNHPNVVKYIGAYQGKRSPILVMELMHETLKTYLERKKGKLSPNRVMEIYSAVCEGMAYLHGLRNPLIHRDLSDKNVLLTETGVVKIADFGQSKLLGDLSDIMQTPQPGTVLYMPPEVLTKEKKKYTAKVDSFSLGVLLLEICTQNPPSSGLDGINHVIEVKRREDDLRLLDDAHPLKSLIVWCLQYEELRPTVDVIHGFIRNDVQNKETVSHLEARNHLLTKERDTAREEIDSKIQHEVRITRELRTSNEEKSRLQETVSHLEASNCELTKELDAAKKEIDVKIQHEVKITREQRASNEEKSRLQHQHQVLRWQYHDSQRTVEELREEIRKLKCQKLKPVYPAAKPVGTSSDSFNKSNFKAVPKAVEEGLFAGLPFGRLEDEQYLLAEALTSSSCQSVVAFGMTGHGKSSFWHFILCRQHFKSKYSRFGDMYSETKTNESAHAIVEGQQLLLIDTPGFRDTQDIGDEGDNKQDAYEVLRDNFRKNIRLAYFAAGEELKAFILVYSLTEQWTTEMTQMTEFLENLSFPWNHCIVVLTHADSVFPGMSEGERYEALKDTMTEHWPPKQLKRIITKSIGYVLIVESTRRYEEEYYRSIVRRFLSLLDSIPGSYTNPHFLHFAQLFKTSQKESYKMALQDKHSMRTLESKTQTVFESFKSAAKEAVVALTEFIGCLQRDFGESDSSISAFKSKVPANLAATREESTTERVRMAYDNAESDMLVERLYQLYQEIMFITEGDDVACGLVKEHNLLFAHLACVHMHGVKDRGEELCSAAENLAIYHNMRKQGKEQITSSEKSLYYSKFNSTEISPSNCNCAFPVGFNHTSGGSVDVAYTVGAKVQVTQLLITSQEADMLQLRTSCIVTLEKEMDTIKALCNLRTHGM